MRLEMRQLRPQLVEAGRSEAAAKRERVDNSLLPALLNLQGGFFLEWSVCDLWGSSAAAGGRVRR